MGGGGYERYKVLKERKKLLYLMVRNWIGDFYFFKKMLWIGFREIFLIEVVYEFSFERFGVL